MSGYRNIVASAVVLLFLACAACAFAADVERSGGPYVPTPQIVVDEMLRMAKVSEKDYVIDLGSGDGVIVLSAAQQYKARGMGVEIDPDLVKRSNDSARALGVSDRVLFVPQDVFKTDLSKATVLTLYLLPEMMLRLRSKLFDELNPGVRIVSHDYHLGQWLPDEQITFTVPEKEFINGAPRAIVSEWFVPAKIAGTWQISVAGGASYELTVRQRFQTVEGSAVAGGKPLRPQAITLRGTDFSFALPDGKGIARFSGRVKDNAMEGDVELPGRATPVHWSAVRTAVQAVSAE